MQVHKGQQKKTAEHKNSGIRISEIKIGGDPQILGGGDPPKCKCKKVTA